MITGSNYKHINPTYLNELAGGEDDFIVQVIDIYLGAVPESTGNLSAAVANSDYEAILFWTHKLRGSFNFVGGKGLIPSLDKIDELCNTGADLAAIQTLVTHVLSVSAEVIVELNSMAEEVKARQA